MLVFNQDKVPVPSHPSARRNEPFVSWSFQKSCFYLLYYDHIEVSGFRKKNTALTSLLLTKRGSVKINCSGHTAVISDTTDKLRRVVNVRAKCRHVYNQQHLGQEIGFTVC